ncbi:DUF4019 domain-containing protein [Duganella sp. Root1480D1]|uniref:DUF4019 domain-containing protein n=1 Tax=Duganella sp. Root1480D1 TaxID=1736471 RepID=UPI00071037CC|nr:DUF4019 domain-containing protein [Duganella sp. Root1480D1]KQZ39597.1 hypothetical protein ASD58_04160 [Duganella sp. Root1480D1]
MIDLLIILAASAAAPDGFGYTSPATALEALKARGDVTVSEEGSWTTADDKANRTLWSFTLPGHPAHPAAVRRTVVMENGQVSIKMNSLCQAKKEACDSMLEEFRRMNTALQQSLVPPKAGGAAPSWQPTGSQKARVEELSKAYFAEKDAAHYTEAWERLGAGLRRQWTFEGWRDAVAFSAARSGVVQRRELKKVTIYRSSQNGTPGTYAAVDFTGSFANADTYCGYLVWSEQADGSFLLMREEENYIYNATAARLTAEQRSKMRGVFRCVD